MWDQHFAPCWDRWSRAAGHRSALADVWNSYIGEHPYDFSLDSQGDGRYVLRVHQTMPMPADFAVVLGEWLYNLRSSLDYLIWATAVHVSRRDPPPGEGALQYPIYDTEQAWKRNSFRLEPLAEHHREMLHIMQPFNSNLDANYLGWINRLARIDRHRRLVDGTAYLAEIEPVVQVPQGTSVVFEWGERVIRHGHADVARIQVSPWDDSMAVDVNPRIGIDPEVAEWSSSPFWRGIPFSQRLRMIELFVAGEIAAYEYDCTGSTRHDDMLTDGFKAEADQRRVPGQVVQARRSDVDWKPAGPGRVSTNDRFLGRDFPTGVTDPRARSRARAS